VDGASSDKFSLKNATGWDVFSVNFAKGLAVGPIFCYTFMV
jgi:hypothetical protein